VTRAKHSLVNARQVQGHGRMSVRESRSGSAGPRPGTGMAGMAAMQQELKLRAGVRGGFNLKAAPTGKCCLQRSA